MSKIQVDRSVLEQVLAVLEHIDNRDLDSAFLQVEECEQVSTAITSLWAVLSQEPRSMIGQAVSAPPNKTLPNC